MRASILTFIFIISEHSIITGGYGNCGDPPEVENAKKVKNVTESKFRMACQEGYVRKAGTSNLFKCIDNSWVNDLALVCFRDPRLPKSDVTTLIHTPASPVTPSWPTATPKTHSVSTHPIRSTSAITTSGKIAITAKHTSSTSSWTFCQTSQRTTTMEETSATTSNTPRITASSTTEKENPITKSSHSSSSFSTTSNETADTQFGGNISYTTGITAGIIITVIIAALAATVALLFWCRRSRSRSHPVEMTIQNPGSDHPLIITHTITIRCPPDTVQPDVTPYEDSPQTTYSDDPLSA